MTDLKLTPTQDLALEVLAARHRLGETHWTFDTRVLPALRDLEAQGLVSLMNGVVERTVRARLTDAGKAEVLSPTYVPPEGGTRLATREQLLATLRHRASRFASYVGDHVSNPYHAAIADIETEGRPPA